MYTRHDAAGQAGGVGLCAQGNQQRKWQEKIEEERGKIGRVGGKLHRNESQSHLAPRGKRMCEMDPQTLPRYAPDTSSTIPNRVFPRPYVHCEETEVAVRQVGKRDW